MVYLFIYFLLYSTVNPVYRCGRIFVIAVFANNFRIFSKNISVTIRIHPAGIQTQRANAQFNHVDRFGLYYSVHIRRKKKHTHNELHAIA